MNSNRIKLVGLLVIKVVLVATLLIAATTKQQYSYYTLLRWLVMSSSIYFVYVYFRSQIIGLSIFFLTTTILFNPFLKIWFQKETWHLIDYAVSTFLILTLLVDYKTFYKE
jgi:hypothetical protein